MCVCVCIKPRGNLAIESETIALLARVSNEKGLFFLSKGHSWVDRLSSVYRLARTLSHATKKLNVEERVEERDRWVNR